MDWIELSAENGLGHFDRPRREVYKAKAFNKSVEVFKKRNPDLWKTDVKQRLRMAMGLLLKDIPLPPSFKDHQLKGNL